MQYFNDVTRGGENVELLYIAEYYLETRLEEGLNACIEQVQALSDKNYQTLKTAGCVLFCSYVKALRSLLMEATMNISVQQL